MKADENKTVMMPNDVCKMLGISRVTLQTWRERNIGPPFLRLNQRTIRYLKKDLERWMQEKRTGDK